MYHIYVRNSLPYTTRLLGQILYHTYILKLTPINTKPIFNTYKNSFEIRLISNSVDWSLPQITIPSTIFIDWESTLNLNLPYPHQVIFPLILIQTSHLIILLKIPTPLSYL